MQKHTVRRRIFFSNGLAIIVALMIIAAINVVLVKLYFESMEREIELTIEQFVDKDQAEEMLADWTVRRNTFILLIGIDGALCVAALVGTTIIFTGKLTGDVMRPLNQLKAGAERIQKNQLTQAIEYTGDTEFEEVCRTFNDMQRHLLDEREKNACYEKARTDMIAGVSHDLRTPLTAVQGTIKGLMDGIAATPEQQQMFLKVAYRRTEEMGTLLNQLFYLSKLETGNMPLSMQILDCSEFLEHYKEKKQALYELEDVEIQVDNENGTAFMDMDLEQMERVLDNLLENSRKYSGQEHLKIKIQLLIDNQSEDKHIEIIFADNGVGMSEEQIGHAFDEFYRGDASRGQKVGNGLGLYIVKYLVEAMDGTVRAENKDGFAVHMRFPMAEI